MKKIFSLTFLIFFLLIFESIAKDTFLSLKNGTVNVRYQPTLNSPIKYIYKKKNLPVKIIDKKENFRKIVDLKKNNGWIHVSQLKKNKSFILLNEKILFSKPTKYSEPIVKFAKGKLLTSKKCKKKWCKIRTEKHLGWLNINNVWGFAN